MSRRTMGILGAIALAVVGTIAIVAYVNDADDRAQAGEELVDVYLVDGTIEAGTSGNDVEDKVSRSQMPARTIADNAVTDLADLEGRVAAVDLVSGEQLLASRWVEEASYDNGRPSLTAVPEGKHEVTISLDPERALGGQIRPGDTVAVYSSFDNVAMLNPLPIDIDRGHIGDQQSWTPESTSHILGDVIVTRVQQERAPIQTTTSDDDDEDALSPGELAPTGNLLITLALDVEDIERVIFTAEFGFVWLSYHPEDAPEPNSIVQDRSSVYEETRPAEPEVTPIVEAAQS